MISPLNRSEASARAAVARSCAFNFVTASCNATERSAFSPLGPWTLRWDSRAAEAKRSTANVSTETRQATIAVRPRSTYALGVSVMTGRHARFR
jgi:hypothetical protein